MLIYSLNEGSLTLACKIYEIRTSQPLGIASDCAGSASHYDRRAKSPRKSRPLLNLLTIDGDIRSSKTFWPEHAAPPTPESFIHLGQRGLPGQGRNVGQRIERTPERREGGLPYSD